MKNSSKMLKIKSGLQPQNIKDVEEGFFVT